MTDHQSRFMLLGWTLCFSLAACEPWPTEKRGLDLDGDGYTSDLDCDDTDPDVLPGADELCEDAKDNDCDDRMDGADADCQDPDPAHSDTVDADGDGVSLPEDCDDGDPSVYPGATEQCEAEGETPKDDDCGGTLESDEPSQDALDCTTYASDGDGDGYGGLAGSLVCLCDPPEPTDEVPLWGLALDCDDDAAAIYPGAPPICTTAGQDADCDGLVSDTEAEPIDPDGCTPWYRDSDGDGEGDPLVSVCTCADEAPYGYTAEASDCPGETLRYTYYLDADRDGFGAEEDAADGASVSRALCGPEGLYTADYASDCDDTDPAYYPGAEERCDDQDRDCDGTLGEQERDTVDCQDYYYDGDGDGYGDDNAVTLGRTGCFCEASDDRVDLSYTALVLDDCDDGEEEISPAAIEVCDGEDNDCDKDIDEYVKTAYYEDDDGDGYGSALSAEFCLDDEESGYVSQTGDCDDTTATVSPGLAEVCDSKDNDCDSVIDEEVTTAYYRDADSDGYGARSTPTYRCDDHDGDYVKDSTDCDDDDDDINPREAEQCDGVDNDCDGVVDDGVKETWFYDGDGDEWGSKTSVELCPDDDTEGYVENSKDCDDTDASIYPMQRYRDSDEDSFGAGALTVNNVCPGTGYADTSTDCNDADASIHPDAEEICDHTDNDCDDMKDEGTTEIWYVDGDGDSFGGAAALLCPDEVTSEHVENADDCDDSKGAVYPGAQEICDGDDNDCDGDADDEDSEAAGGSMPGCCYAYIDADKDAYGEEGSISLGCTCVAETKRSFTPSDCDDDQKDTHPLVVDVPLDGTDSDCDGGDNTSDLTFAPESTYLPTDDAETGLACWLYTP